MGNENSYEALVLKLLSSQRSISFAALRKIGPRHEQKESGCGWEKKTAISEKKKTGAYPRVGKKSGGGTDAGGKILRELERSAPGAATGGGGGRFRSATASTGVKYDRD